MSTLFGIGGCVLVVQVVLSDRQQAVSLTGVTSAFHSVVCGVPQGSVLGPQMFLRYTAHVALIAQRHHVAVRSYADDAQLYASCSVTDASTASLISRTG